MSSPSDEKPDDAGETRLVGHRLAAGQTELSAPAFLDDEGGTGIRSGTPVIDRDGVVTAVFLQGGQGQEQVYATRWGQDAAPSDEESISSPREAFFPAEGPRVVVDATGRVTAVWLQLEGPNKAHLYSSERVDGAGFAFPQRVSPANENVTADESSEPPSDASPAAERSVRSGGYDLAVDAEGTATIAYIDAADLTGLVDADLKASRRASGGTWSDPVALSPELVRLAYGAIAPAVAAGRAGQVDVLFAEVKPLEEHDVIGVGGTIELMATRFEGPPPPAAQHQTLVRSRHEDRAGILVQWCPAAGLEHGERAPTIIAGSGWGIPGRRCPGANSPEEEIESVFGSTPVEAFTDAGYNVLTFDARGFWRSGGEAQVDSPEYEGKDMQALIDYVAHQPGAQLDGPGDPRLGMSGGSYGGGIQFVTAALDQRVDAIAPAISWNSLVTSLFPRETIKAGWAAILVGAGVPMTTLPGVLSPAGIQQGHMAPQVYTATQQGATAGTIDAGLREWFEDRGPQTLLSRITAPTLIIQGTVDTMFPLDEAHRNFEALRSAGTEVGMLWFCGGHGACERTGEDQEHVDARVLAWFDRHLRGADADTGPLFEWVDEDGRWHESAQYPPAQGEVIRGSGSGTLSLTPGELPGSGVAIFATPYTFGGADHPAAVEVPITGPANGTPIVGAPQLRLRYTATGVSTYGAAVDGAAKNRTYVYAQIVDDARHRVVGNQATPIPITLDGQEHELSLSLERIATKPTSAGYSLQIVPQTSVYDGQRAAGRVDLRSIDIELPLAGSGVGTSVLSATGQSQTQTQPARRRATRRPTCRGLSATIVGTPGADVINGTRRRDVIVALGGNDTIVGRRGNDIVCAGAGRDAVLGQRGEDALSGGKGNDRLVGGAGRDTLVGERGHDVLLGGFGNDRLSGGRGRDRLTGGPGRDRLLGGSGRDLLRADPRDLRVLGGSGLDRIAGLR